MMTAVLACCALLTCGMFGCASTQRVPTWGVLAPGAGFDHPTGLPDRVIHRASGIELVLIAPGRVVPLNRVPQTPIWITKPFYIGKYEVSYDEWRRFMPVDNEAEFHERRDCPIVRVAQDGALDFARRAGLRLPTWAEYHYVSWKGLEGLGHPLRIAPKWHVGPAWGFHAHKAEKAVQRPNSLGVYGLNGTADEWGVERDDIYPACVWGCWWYQWGRQSSSWDGGAHDGFRVARDP